MQQTPLLLSSPNPLPNECEKHWLIYLISSGIGLLLGLIPGLISFDLPLCLTLGLLFGLLGLGIGWGIADKVAKAKCHYLPRKSFCLPAPLNTTELYNQLTPLLAPMNIPIEMTSQGNLRLTYNGLLFTICYANNSTFTINWSQPLGKSLFNKGFYGILYKKLITGMGFVGYYVQQACNTTRQVQFSTTILPPATHASHQENAQASSLLCPHCHTMLPADSRFCGSCGKTLIN